MLGMKSHKLVWVSILPSLLWSLGALAQDRRVAVTIDDLPYASAHALSPQDAAEAEEINRKLLSALRHHHVPVTGFVIEKSVEDLGIAAGKEILKKWTSGEFDLGNHTYSHPDVNQLSLAQIEDEIIRGETSFVPLMKQAGKKPEFFRFPMNHTGDTKEKHEQVAAFLSQRGYRLATCTIDNSDYLFNSAYVRMLAKHDSSARKLRVEYLSYTSAEIDYYADLNKQVFGYDPPSVMLLHDNRLNADVIDQLLRLFEKKRYKFVSLDRAQSDPAYQVPDTYISKYGPMWGYRWAAERGVKVNGKLEAEPPEWILQNSQEP
ncbi:putative Polysaccharide deacetylase [Candidatus Sulfotelmatobacter kueseliae]|uniref:Putative Polysaccharide deacetylase n=1 Tax=Candidatus Sulfotelmatobacter kueseliae TaxID=2042962 RepID=A0A2U3KWX4_9BACT|nr:putative Polysaccharide deacetylase [Candidatus Sulfotelmatobacter kueseliae]